MPLTVQKKIMVVKGVVTVLQNNTVLYQTNTQQNIQPKITFNLPKDETAIQYQDTDGIAQIRPEDIPSLVITVKDKNGNILDTVANITSTRGLLAPGTVQEKSVIQNNSSKKQILFNQANDFIVKDGRLDIALYPTFKAGNDIITINIPGIAPINIPVVVAP